jgi:hypothetical protein
MIITYFVTKIWAFVFFWIIIIIIIIPFTFSPSKFLFYIFDICYFILLYIKKLNF